MSKELRFEQGFGNRGTVDRDKRPIRTRAIAVHGPSHELFAGPALATDQDRCLGPSDSGDALEQQSHRLAATDHVVFEIDFGLEGFIRSLEPRCLSRLFAHRGSKRCDDEQEPDVPRVHLVRSRRFRPNAAGHTIEDHHGRDDDLSCVKVGGDRYSFVDSGLEQGRVDMQRGRARLL